MGSTCLTVLQFLLVVSPTLSYPSFRDIIPNGNIVPHPCKANYLWRGVGHINPLGGGDRNDFGLDFHASNKVWTKELCNKDSDGDGRTNGQELGDPNCIWQPGQIPERVTDITHPGICTSSEGQICDKHIGLVDCNVADGLQGCDVLKEPETRNITIRFPETEVPSDETTYSCMTFNLPADGDFHLMAYTPYIDNQEVMHHILLYGCDPNEAPVPDDELNKVSNCGMGAGRKCRNLIGLWAVGFTGYCMNGPMGYRFGMSGMKQAALEFHWNNPKNVQNYKDSSGMTLYYTPKLRPNDAAILMVGQTFLELPPNSASVTAVGKCHSSCSKIMMTGPVNVFWAINHMHYLGHSMKMEVFRNGVFYTELTNDPVYSYDSPVEHKYSTAVQLLPGDEIVTTCEFKTLSRSKTTFQGDATSDEMCFGFLSFYPSSSMPQPFCTAWKDIPVCDMWYRQEHKNCKWYEFMTLATNQSAEKAAVLSNCRPFQSCTAECKNTVRRIFAEHPCMQGDVHDLIRQFSVEWNSLEMLNFFAAVDSCKVELAAEQQTGNGDNINGGQSLLVTFHLLLFLLAFAIFTN